jgi:predicted DCC family thiol-disulfide oxidoreductase YuxK
MKLFQPVELPSPTDRPDAAVLIFDGHCQFCQAQVRRVASWDSNQRLAFLSLHDPVVQERYPDLSHDVLMQAMVIVDPTGERHVGAGAARYLSRVIPRMWLLAPLLHVPGSLPLWQWGYRQVAERRYRWNQPEACENGSCSVHFRR